MCNRTQMQDSHKHKYLQTLIFKFSLSEKEILIKENYNVILSALLEAEYSKHYTFNKYSEVIV